MRAWLGHRGGEHLRVHPTTPAAPTSTSYHGRPLQLRERHGFAGAASGLAVILGMTLWRFAAVKENQQACEVVGKAWKHHANH